MDKIELQITTSSGEIVHEFSTEAFDVKNMEKVVEGIEETR